jgi:hypothetical protein
MTATTGNLTALYKVLYPKGVPYDVTYQDFPFLTLVKRNEQFFGESMKIPLKYANNSGRSATFSTAQANQSYTKNVAFFLTRVSDYAVAKITNEAIEASEADPGAFVRTFKHEVEGAMKAAIESEAVALMEDGTGAIAQIDSGVTLASTTLTLRDPETVVRFEVGQKISFSATRGGTLRASGASLTVSAIDRDAGVLTMSANLSTIAGITVNDYILVEGDFNGKMSGFDAWIPYTAPSSTAFFGVDRTADIVRLAGVRDDFSSLPIEEALVKGLKRTHREGSNADYAFINFEKFAELENALGSKVQYVDVNSPVGIGFRGVKVNSGKRPVTVLADMTVASDRLKVVQLDTWELASLKKSVRILDQDGMKSLRVSDADAQEIRIGGYKNVACYAPGYNGHFAI